MSAWDWTVDEGGERADRAILRALEAGLGTWTGEAPGAFSRSQLQKWIEDGRVTVDGAPVRAGLKLAAGARVRVEPPPPRSMELVPEDRPLDILFQDEHLVVVNKPPGLTVHPSETQSEGTLVHALLHHIKDLSGIGGVLRPGIVHRLDKDTSGALVITKTDAAHQKLAEVFSVHAIERRYWALVYGELETPREGELRVESTIGRSTTDRKKMAMDVEGGRHSVTLFKRLETFSYRDKAIASLVEARLETGRTHQVRVHLTGTGHSLMGDPVYGVPSDRNTKWTALPADVRKLVEAMPGQALHARVLGFEHPISGKALRFEAEPPEGFARLLEALRGYL
jgi:23S rRNA pseudouridine1911/1915/1917 synthase